MELQRNETLYWEKAHKEVRPLGDCPGNCTSRGGCVLPWPDAPAGTPSHCECYYGWEVRRHSSPGAKHSLLCELKSDVSSHTPHSCF